MQSEKPFLRVLEHRSFDGGVVLAVEGELDLATVAALERPLVGLCRRNDAITVDLRRVQFLDCVGLRSLLRLSAEGDEYGCRVEFIQGPEPVARVFELTGTGGQLAFVDAMAPPAAVSTA
jgi:anti-anti-sigma factor